MILKVLTFVIESQDFYFQKSFILKSKVPNFASSLIQEARLLIQIIIHYNHEENRQKFFYLLCEGNHLNFDVFSVNFEERSDWKDLLPECAEFLIRPDIKKKKTWGEFAVSFFAAYRTPLCARWGYEPETVNNHCLKVTDRRCLMAVVSALYHSGIIVATVDELAENIINLTDISYTFSTVRRHVSDGWEEYDDILDIINMYKKDNSGK